MKTGVAAALVAAVCAWVPALAQTGTVVVSFDDREYDGWTILGYQDSIWVPEGGNPGAHLSFFLDNFFIRVYNETSPDFTGDFTTKGPVEISGDLRWRIINFFGTDVTRDLFFAIWDEYVDAQGVPRTHVVYRPLGKIRGQGANAPWRRSAIRIPDPTSPDMPGGWLYWNFDGSSEPTRALPPGVTWSGILSSVDRVQWTTATPGLLFGFTFFDVSFDNATIQPLKGGGGGAPQAQGAEELTALVGLDVTARRFSGLAPDETGFNPDGKIDQYDLDRFRSWYDAGLLLADVTSTGAVEGDWNWGLSDGVVDHDDLLVYEEAWLSRQ